MMATRPKQIILGPQPGRQTQFLASPADVTVYGGSAGGGKSYGLILDPLRHVVNNSKFSAVIIRQTFSRIIKAGGLWDTANDVYPLTGAKARISDLRWDWSHTGGGRIEFGHVSHEEAVKAYQGSQIAALLIDEATEISEKSFWFLFSRNRSVSGIKPYTKMTCNPDPDSFVASLVDWYIAKDGYADLDRVGTLRWFVRYRGKLEWGMSKQAVLEDFSSRLGVPISELWEHGIIPKSLTFIPATVFDNEILLRADPGYLATLNALPPIERARFLGDKTRGGNWKIRPSAGNFFNSEWFKVRQAKLPAGGRAVRFWDFAATEEAIDTAAEDEVSASKKKGPAHTAGVLLLEINDQSPVKHYCVMDAADGPWGPNEVEEKFHAISLSDKRWADTYGIDYVVRWEQEPGSASIREGNRMAQWLAAHGIDGGGIPSTRDKYLRAKPAAIAAKARLFELYPGSWNDDFTLHLHNQPQDLKDMMDAFSGAYEYINGESEGTTLEAAPFTFIHNYRG